MPLCVCVCVCVCVSVCVRACVCTRVFASSMCILSPDDEAEAGRVEVLMDARSVNICRFRAHDLSPSP